MTRSPACRSNFERRLRSASFFMFVQSAVPVTVSIASLVESGALPAEKGTVFAQSAEVWKKFSSDMSPPEFHRMCNEIWHALNVDSLTFYLSDILLDVFLQRPEVLRSTESIPVIEILTCESMAEVVRKIADRKVEGLGYRAFDDLLTYLQVNLGLPLALDDAVVSTVREAIEVRNIIVHNAGRVSATFVRRTKRSDLRVGEPFPIDYDYVLSRSHSIEKLIKELDAAIIDHFHLTYAQDKERPDA